MRCIDSKLFYYLCNNYKQNDTNMEITGKIIQAMEPQSGVSRSGNNWRKREYVLETLDNYPKKVCFNFFGDRVDQYPLNVGDVIKLSFDLNSREFNGRWYTDVSGWKAEPAGQAAGPGMPPPPMDAMPGGYPTVPGPIPPADGDEGIPF